MEPSAPRLPLAPLLATLSKAFDLDGEGVADVLWLVQWMTPTVAAVRIQIEPPAPQTASRSATPDRANLLGTSHPIVDPTLPEPTIVAWQKPVPQPSSKDGPAPVVLPEHRPEEERVSPLQARALRIPAGAALPGALEIVRALRPVPRWRTSRTDRVLDEDATVEETARCANLLVPVLCPRVERWFDAALVEEDSESAELWHDTVIEFERVLRYAGVFRDVKRYSLRLSPQTTLIAATGAEQPVSSLRDRSGRRVVFMFGSGTSKHWADGSLGAIVANWGEATPVVMVHALPERMWRNTVLGDTDVLASLPFPGMPNSALRTMRAWWQPPRRMARPERVFPLPVFALNRSSAEQWAKMLATRRGTMASGFLVRTEAATNTEPKRAPRPPAHRQATAAERVQEFQVSASDGSIRLAVRLASGPFTVRWMRTLQASVLGSEARHEQLAEILLSGLVQRLTPIASGVPADEVQFRFQQDVAAVLDQMLGDDEAKATAALVRSYIYAEYGRSMEARVWLGDAEGPASVMPAAARPLVTLYKKLLDRVSLLSSPTADGEWPGRDYAPGSVLAAFGGPERRGSAMRGLRIVWCARDLDSVAGEVATLKACGAIVAGATTLEAYDALPVSSPDILVLSSDLASGPDAAGWLALRRSISHSHVVLYQSGRGEASTEVDPSEYAPVRITTQGRSIAVLGAVAASRSVERLASRVVRCLVAIGVPYSTAELLLTRPAPELARATMEQESLDQLHYVVARLVAAITNCGSVLLCDPDDEQPLGCHVVADDRAERELSITGVMRRAASSRLTQWVPDVSREAGYVAADPASRSQLAIPFQARPLRVGVLNLESQVADAFRDDQIRWLETLVASFYPASLSSPERVEARVIAEQAQRAFEMGFYDDAIEMCTRGLAIAGDLELLRQRALAYWYSHLYRDSVADFDRVIAARGRRAGWNILAERGQVLVELERYSEALVDLDAAIDGVRGDLELSAFMRRARAVAYGVLGRDAEAEEDFRLSRVGGPQNAWLDYSIAQYRKSRGAPDEEVLEWYVAAIVRRGPPLNQPKRETALEAIGSLLNLGSPELLSHVWRGDLEHLRELAAVASERGHPISVVACAALYALAPTIGHREALADAYANIGKSDRARHHREAVTAARRDADAAESVPSEPESARPTDSAGTSQVPAGWIPRAVKRLFKAFGSGS